MKKILCFIDNLGSGGAQRQMVNLAGIFKKHGYDVELLIYDARNDFYLNQLKEKQIKFTCLQSRSYLQRLLTVTKYLRLSDADVVIPFMETPCFLACLAKSLGAKWKLITNELSAKESTFRGLKNKIYTFFERFSDFKVCNSENAKGLWLRHKPQYSGKLKVIYNPVLMPAQNSIFISERERLKIVVAASFQRLKNSVSVVKAIVLLPADLKDRLRIEWYGRKSVNGSTEVYDETSALILSNNLEKTVSLYDATPEIYSKMATADAVGLFSTVEGLPNAVCEGMMLGKPILMTRISDYNILVDENGLLCDPNPQSIAEMLKQFIELSDSERLRMGKISKFKAINLFSEDVISKQWIELIEN